MSGLNSKELTLMSKSTEEVCENRAQPERYNDGSEEIDWDGVTEFTVTDVRYFSSQPIINGGRKTFKQNKRKQTKRNKQVKD